MGEEIYSLFKTGDLNTELCAKLLQVVFDTSLNEVQVLNAVRNPENKIIDFRYVLVNKAARLHAGRTELEGQSFIVEYPSAKKTGLFARLVKVVEMNTVVDEKLHYTRHDGSDAWFHIKAQQFEDGIIICREEVTGQNPKEKLPVEPHKQAPVEDNSQNLTRMLTITNRELESLNTELKIFNAIIATDYRNLLRNLYTNLEYVTSKDARALSDSGKANIRRAQSSVQKMNLMAQDVLAYADLYKPEIGFADVDLNDIVYKELKEFNGKLEQVNAKVEFGELPVLKGLPSLLSLLFHNLADNAVKFRNDHDQLVITIRSSRINGMYINHSGALPDTWYHAISISDNGIGFEHESINKIFDIFYRLHERNKYNGSGIGLSICKKIMEMHDGLMTVESVPGLGTTFNCFFPIDKK